MRTSHQDKTTIGLSVCAALLVVAGGLLPAAASTEAGGSQPGSPYVERFFAGAGINYIIPSVTDMPEVQNALGFKVTAGYQLRPSLAFLIDYILVPSMKNKEDASVEEYSSRYYAYVYAEQPLTEASFRSFCFSLRYTFDPLTSHERWRPYVAGGLGSMRVKAEKYASLPPEYADIAWDSEYYGLDSVSGTFVKLAVGMEHQFKQDINWLFELEYVNGNGDITDYSHIAIGTRLAYHF